MSTPFKMQGFSGFGNSPMTQKKAKKKVQTEFDVGDREVEFVNTEGDVIAPAGSSVKGDIQKIYTDRSSDNLSSSDTLYYNQRTGNMNYYDPETEETSNMGGFSPGKPYLGTKK